jgi:hypothetical protein
MTESGDKNAMSEAEKKAADDAKQDGNSQENRFGAGRPRANPDVLFDRSESNNIFYLS